jgi:molybdate transport system substrate-binding protein
MMKKLASVTLFVIFVLILSACSTTTPTVIDDAAATKPSAAEVTLKVFAPSSLNEAAKEMATAFETANPGVKVAIEFGHTPTQRIQFTQGASGDVFMTASKKDMDDAITDKTVVGGKETLFARNQLVVILPPTNPAGLEKLEDLAKDGIKLVVATTETPVGKFTITALEKMDKQFGADFQAKVTANVVSNESGVKPIVSKVKMGEADAGIVYVSDTVSAPDLKTIQIPAELNMISQLFIAPLAKAGNTDQAEAFATFVNSPDGQVILQKWGFLSGKP